MGLPLVVLTGAFLVPGRARAGCDNHAFLHAANSIHDAPIGAKLGMPQTHADPLKGRRPCSGPNCSRGSDPVPLAPLLPSASAADQWLYLAPVQVAPDLGNPSFLEDHGWGRPMRRNDPIDPPPRLSPSSSV
jgi:hypothetical protein